MPVRGFNEVIAPAPSSAANAEQGPTPGWAPAWLPSKPTLDYLSALAGVAFLILGAMYFVGVNPVRPFTRAHVADV